MSTLFRRRLTSASAEVKFGEAKRPQTKRRAAERPLRGGRA
jgi:hypothetical protein